MNKYHYNRSHLAEFDDEDPLLPTFIHLIEGALFICILLLVIVVMQNRDLNDEVEMQKATAEKATAMLAECFNGGALLDKATDTAYFCDKPVEVRL